MTADKRDSALAATPAASDTSGSKSGYVTRLKRRLLDDVWCLTCDHAHIPTIPAVTFMCADCGFGQWAEDIAEDHATDYPDHVVYPRHHRTVPL